MGKKEILLGDCLELMKDIPNGSIDMILCDLPYGTTACKWDVIIPFDKLYNDSQQGILKFPNNSHNDLNDALVQAIARHFLKKQTKVKRVR